MTLLYTTIIVSGGSRLESTFPQTIKNTLGFKYPGVLWYRGYHTDAPNPNNICLTLWQI